MEEALSEFESISGGCWRRHQPTINKPISHLWIRQSLNTLREAVLLYKKKEDTPFTTLLSLLGSVPGFGNLVCMHVAHFMALVGLLPAWVGLKAVVSDTTKTSDRLAARGIGKSMAPTLLAMICEKYGWSEMLAEAALCKKERTSNSNKYVDGIYKDQEVLAYAVPASPVGIRLVRKDKKRANNSPWPTKQIWEPGCLLFQPQPPEGAKISLPKEAMTRWWAPARQRVLDKLAVTFQAMNREQAMKIVELDGAWEGKKNKEDMFQAAESERIAQGNDTEEPSESKKRAQAKRLLLLEDSTSWGTDEEKHKEMILAGIQPGKRRRVNRVDPAEQLRRFNQTLDFRFEKEEENRYHDSLVNCVSDTAYCIVSRERDSSVNRFLHKEGILRLPKYRKSTESMRRRWRNGAVGSVGKLLTFGINVSHVDADRALRYCAMRRCGRHFGQVNIQQVKVSFAPQIIRRGATNAGWTTKGSVHVPWPASANNEEPEVVELEFPMHDFQRLDCVLKLLRADMVHSGHTSSAATAPVLEDGTFHYGPVYRKKTSARNALIWYHLLYVFPLDWLPHYVDSADWRSVAVESQFQGDEGKIADAEDQTMARTKYIVLSTNHAQGKPFCTVVRDPTGIWCRVEPTPTSSEQFLPISSSDPYLETETSEDPFLASATAKKKRRRRDRQKRAAAKHQGEYGDYQCVEGEQTHSVETSPPGNGAKYLAKWRFVEGSPAEPAIQLKDGREGRPGLFEPFGKDCARDPEWVRSKLKQWESVWGYKAPGWALGIGVGSADGRKNKYYYPPTVQRTIKIRSITILREYLDRLSSTPFVNNLPDYEGVAREMGDQLTK